MSRWRRRRRGRPEAGRPSDPGAAHVESEVFELSPVARASAGRLLLGGVLGEETIRTHYRTARLREGVKPTEFLQTP